MSEPTQIHNEELWHRGYLVGLLAESGVPDSVMDSFRGEFDSFMPRYEGECADIRQQAYGRVLEAAKEESSNGLLRISELEKLIDRLLEESQ